MCFVSIYGPFPQNDSGEKDNYVRTWRLSRFKHNLNNGQLANNIYSPLTFSSPLFRMFPIKDKLKRKNIENRNEWNILFKQ